MDDSTLLRVAVAIGLIGIICLFFFRHAVIDESIKPDPGDSIVIHGKVIRKITRDNMEVLKVEEKRLVDIVIFDRSGFMEGDWVSIHGKVDEYKGKEQVIADHITLE